MNNPGAKEAVLDNERPAATLRNLVFVAMVIAGLALIGQGWAVGLEVYRNLGGSVMAWLVCAILGLIGVLVLWGSYVQALTWRDVWKNSPRKGELVAMFLIMVLAASFGSALGSNLDWRLDWTSGVALEGHARQWRNTQGCLGWILTSSALVGVWSILAQIRTGQKKP